MGNAEYMGDKIVLLTTYNGQKALLKDIVEKRCANHPRFQRPNKITTVDKYQGKQNEYVLISLVKTRNIGHIKDVRRLVVALSRARLGLYIFGRVKLFASSVELQTAFRILMDRPTSLALLPKENWRQCHRRL